MEFPDVTAVDILLSGWMKSESPPHEVLARILDAAVCVKKHEDQHRRKTRDICKVYWVCRCDLGTFIVNRIKCVIFV